VEHIRAHSALEGALELCPKRDEARSERRLKFGTFLPKYHDYRTDLQNVRLQHSLRHHNSYCSKKAEDSNHATLECMRRDNDRIHTISTLHSKSTCDTRILGHFDHTCSTPLAKKDLFGGPSVVASSSRNENISNIHGESECVIFCAL